MSIIEWVDTEADPEALEFVAVDGDPDGFEWVDPDPDPEAIEWVDWTGGGGGVSDHSELDGLHTYGDHDAADISATLPGIDPGPLDEVLTTALTGVFSQLSTLDNEKADYNYTGTGLYAGLEALPAAVTQSEGILDRWLFGPAAYTGATAQALNLATLTTTGGAPTPNHGVAPDGTGATRVLVLDRATAAENGVYVVSTGLVWTKGSNPDVFDPPGNGYRFTVKPTGGDPAKTWMATMDAHGFVFRGGSFSYEAIIDGEPYTWTLLDSGGGGAVDSVNGETGTVVLDAADVGAVPTSRTINGLDLTANRTLTAADVGAATSGHNHSGVYDPAGTAAALVLPWLSRWSVSLVVDQPTSYVTWTPTTSAVAGGGYAAGATTVGSETWVFAGLPLRAGTYRRIITYRRHSAGGIITASLTGGISAGTVDTYNAATAGDQRDTLDGIVIPTSGLYDLTLTNPTKNASSSAYGWTLQAVALIRTGS